MDKYVFPQLFNILRILRKVTSQAGDKPERAPHTRMFSTVQWGLFGTT